MPNLDLTCEGCGTKFVWTEKEQQEFEEKFRDEADLLDVEAFCKMCRPKQDGQRS